VSSLCAIPRTDSHRGSFICELGGHSTLQPLLLKMLAFALLLGTTCVAARAATHVVPGKVKPTFPATYDMARSSGMMTCNASGPVDPVAASKWGLIDLDVRASCQQECPASLTRTFFLIAPAAAALTSPLPHSLTCPDSGMAASQCGPPPTP
jgi:hypothetical protein